MSLMIYIIYFCNFFLLVTGVLKMDTVIMVQS